MNIKQGLKPLIGEGARILILGSLPGEISLKNQEYYANPNNMFWDIMGTILDEKIPNTYPEKVNYLKRHGIALWDVLHTAEREGSLDSNIRNEEFNDIAKLVCDHPSIDTIVTNGGKAEKLLRKYIKANPLNKKIYFCKSTSGMIRCAGWNLQKLSSHWSSIL